MTALYLFCIISLAFNAYALHLVRKLERAMALPPRPPPKPQEIETFRSGGALPPPDEDEPPRTPTKPRIKTDGLTTLAGSRIRCPACAKDNIRHPGTEGPTEAVVVNPDEKRLSHRVFYQRCQSCNSEWLVKP